MLIAPIFVDARIEPGTAENAAIMPPAFDLSSTVAEPRSLAMITPASVCALTSPVTEVSVIAPARVDARTATPRGTWTAYSTPHTSSALHEYDSVNVVPATRREVSGGVLEYEACCDT